ncbi:MAG TPA: DUF11 domain-containing protein [Mycobacteriales bacterium]|nr:DUF11 domain-containing protein [Mycobacteriales bacterium]
MNSGVAAMAVLPMALLGVVGAVAVPAAHAADVLTTTSPYAGYSTGSVVYANAVNLGGNPDVTKASTANSAAGVAENGKTLTLSDQLLQPTLLEKSATGKTAYGHAAGVNVGLLQDQAAAGQLVPVTADAVSPTPSKDTGKELLNVPLSPLATADVLPGNAQANTTADHQCVATGQPISEGDAHAANAKVLDAAPTAVVGTVNATDDTTSETMLAAPTTATGAPIASQGQALSTDTSQNLAPIILFAGTPLEIEVDVLKPLVLKAVAGGVPGSAHVSYGVPGLSGSVPVITVKAFGQTQTLTTADLLGGQGLTIALGVADVTIGTPAHSLTGLEGTPVTATADGTQASAAADVVRVTIPGKIATPGVSLGGPLSPLAGGLNTLVGTLGMITGPIQSALNSAGLGVADLRYGHMESSATVPVGGIICKSPNHPAPFDESYKDTSSNTVAAGKTFSYTVRFPNRGDLPVNNVKVVDTYTGGPPALEFVSSVPAPASRSGNTLTYSFGTLQPGEYASITLTFRVPADAKAGTQYHNTATISGTYNGAPVTKTVHVDAPTVLPLGPAGCNLSYSTKYASNKKVKTGENFAYYIDVLNAGATTCTDVTVKDTLTTGVTFVSCSNSCTHSGQNVSWSIGDLEPGASKVLQVVVHTTAKSGTLPNTADLASTNGGSGSPHTPGPAVSTVSVGNPANPAACPTSVCKVQPARQLAFTGGLGPTTIALGLLGSSGLLLMVRRRRASDI